METSRMYSLVSRGTGMYERSKHRPYLPLQTPDAWPGYSRTTYRCHKKNKSCCGPENASNELLEPIVWNAHATNYNNSAAFWSVTGFPTVEPVFRHVSFNAVRVWLHGGIKIIDTSRFRVVLADNCSAKTHQQNNNSTYSALRDGPGRKLCSAQGTSNKNVSFPVRPIFAVGQSNATAIYSQTIVAS